MAFAISCKAITVQAGTAVTIYRMVAIASDGQADHVAGAQGDVDGVCGESEATVGQPFAMVVPDGGVAMIEAGAAVALGALIASNASGQAITWVDAAGNVCMGRALEAAAASGDVIAVNFLPKKVGAGS